MVYTLNDVKKEMKKFHNIKRVFITLDQFGEGYNTYIDVWYLDKHLNKELETYTIGEEETKGKAVSRGKRAYDSLIKINNNVSYEGIPNC